MVVLGPPTTDQPCCFSTVDEANGAVVLEEQVVGNFTNGWPPWIGVPPDGEQQLMLCRGEASGTSLLFAPPLEVAKAGAERKQTGVDRISQCHSLYDIILLR